MTGTFAANKKVWNTGASKVVVHSWAVASNASRQDYQVQIFTGTGTPVIFTEVTSLTGQSDTYAPTAKITETLTNIVLYGALTVPVPTLQTFYRGISIVYRVSPLKVNVL